MKKAMRIIPHITIIIAGMILVLLVVDGINSAMNFINNAGTKGLMYVLCILTILQSIIITAIYRNSIRRKNRRD